MMDKGAIYAGVDANNDGSVDMREFIRWLYNENPAMDTDKGDSDPPHTSV